MSLDKYSKDNNHTLRANWRNSELVIITTNNILVIPEKCGSARGYLATWQVKTSSHANLYGDDENYLNKSTGASSGENDPRFCREVYATNQLLHGPSLSIAYHSEFAPGYLSVPLYFICLFIHELITFTQPIGKRYVGGKVFDQVSSVNDKRIKTIGPNEEMS